PTSSAPILRPSGNSTSMSSASSTTWWLISTSASPMITPDPRLARGWRGISSPKNRRNSGSSSRGLPVGPSASSWLVRTLTTEGMARLAALAYDRIEASPEGGGTGSPVEREGTSIRAGPVVSRSAEGSHSGRSTARVKSTASPTVTVCANNNQSERSMERTTKRPAGRPTRPAEPRQVGIAELAERVGRWLEVERFADYCPNGLQVEGARPIRRLVSGVTASLELIDAATELEADALLVHHGWFWKGEDSRLVGL